jgi:hypothetical protein
MLVNLIQPSKPFVVTLPLATCWPFLVIFMYIRIALSPSWSLTIEPVLDAHQARVSSFVALFPREQESAWLRGGVAFMR